MRGLRKLLLEEQVKLEKVIKETKARLENAPEGRLRLSKSHNHVQYYCCTEEKKSGNYIPKGHMELAQNLAQKGYDCKILQLAEKRLSQISKLAKDYTDDELEQIYLKEHPERQKLMGTENLCMERARVQGKRFSRRNANYFNRKRRTSSLEIRKDYGRLFL